MHFQFDTQIRVRYAEADRMGYVYYGNYAVYFDRLKHIIWVMPIVTLWFSYRGLQNYFIFWVPMLVASAIYIYKERIRV